MWLNIWNGYNQYVFDWMTNHFDPVSMLPIEVQKYASGDDWLAHVYRLDTRKFMRYFDVDTPVLAGG